MYLLSALVYFNQLFVLCNSDHLLKCSPFGCYCIGHILTADLPSKASQTPSPSLCLKAIVQLSIRSERDIGISCLLAIRAFSLIHCCFVWVRFTLFDEAICVRPACSLFKQITASNLDLFDCSHIQHTAKQQVYNEAMRACL